VIEDKYRWNEKHKNAPLSDRAAGVVEKYIGHAKKGRALDIACGMGRNSRFMAQHGFIVDAVDYSDFALSQVGEDDNITTIEADLDHYEIQPQRYDLIVNCNYLDRRYFSQIKSGLKKGGVVIFETFVTAGGEGYHQPSNPDFVLRNNELCENFSEFDVIFYEEREDVNPEGEKVRVASLVARRV
jgi:SAM-dependent methyltransferase